MKKFPLLIAGILFSVLTFAQTLNLDVPVTLSNGAFGETVQEANSGYNIITRGASQIFATPATSSGGNYSLGSATSFFPNSADYSIYYRTTGGNPEFYKTGAAGTAPNRNITLDGADFTGASTFNITPNTPQDDYGVRTIGTTDGILTAALRKTNSSDLYRIVMIKTNATGTIQWQTSIPTAQTGYDDTFTGQDANGNFVTELTPEPFVKQIKEVADGYIIVNMSRRYFPPGTSELFATFIKLDFSGNILWSSTETIPTRANSIGDAPSSEGNIRYFVGDVTGFEDGNTYISYAGGGDLRPYAQVLILDNTGASIANYSTTYIVLDDGSFQVKKFNNRIYWLRRTETFFENTAPIFTNDFSIVDITDGFNLTDPAVAILPPTPGEFYVPNDMELTPEGNFLVTGSKYPLGSLNGNNPDPNDAEPFAVILEANLNSSNGVDLALSAAADNEAVAIYQDVEITYTVTNEGNATATDVVATISRTSGSVLAGSSPVNASQGSFDLGYTENAVWEIGNLAAGQTETLTLTYFTLSENTTFFGEISAMNESDSDSTPNNGTFGNPQEDDEAGIDIGQQAGMIRGTVFLDQNRDGGENCQLDGCIFIPNIEINLYIQGTNTLVATATSQANGSYIFPNVAPGSYTLEYEYQDNYVPTPFFGGNTFQFNNNFLVINNEPAYIGVLVGNGGEQIFNLGLVDGTECTLEELFVETICDNNGTPNNPNDDTFEVNFRADGQGRGSYTLNGNAGSLTNNSITYSEGFELIGPFDTDELPVTLTVNNLGNLPSTPCSLSETITSVDCGSTGGGQPDLAIMTTGNLPASMQPGQNYPPAANIINSGSATTGGQQFFNYIYLSTDANLDASDLSLSVIGLLNFAPGESNEFLNIFIPANTTLGDYYILYVVDEANAIEESNENNNILARPITVGPVGTGGVDLELTASADVPTIYQNGEAVFTLTNTGSETATNIEVLFAKNSSLNITGEPTTTQGISAVHWTDAPEWSVGTLAAGQSAMITFDIFALSATPTLYGQVVFQSEADADSTPDNGNGSTAVEDDEAVYPGGGSTGGEGLQVNCNTTTNPPSPIAVNPDININAAQVSWTIPTATTDCPGGIVNIEQINGPTNPGGFFTPVGNGYDVVFEITDECGNSEICIIPFNVNGFAGELVCPDDITVTATSAAGAIVTFEDAVPYTACNANPTGPADGEPMSGDLFPIGETEIFFSEFFSGNPSFCQNLENCRMTVTVLPEGGGGDGVDLELTASSDAPSIWQSGTAIFTISNNGNETATGVELEFDKNASLNITSTPTVTQGTSQLHWTDTPRWNVGTLNPGESETITFDVFAISENINFFGEVTAQNQSDFDSTPNNGNGTSANEDDEAVYPGGGGTGGGNQADLTLSNLNTSGPAAPGDISEYTVLVSNIGTVTAPGSYVIGAYLSTDNQLSSNDVQVGVINTGNTPVGTEPLTTGAITVPANQAIGNYFLILETDTNGNIPESNENNNVISTPISISVTNPTCNLAIGTTAISCSTAGTPNDPSDDTYSFTFTVTGQTASNTANMSSNASIPSTVNLGQAYTITGIPASSVPQVNLTASAPTDASCQTFATVYPPANCGQGTSSGGCGLSAEVAAISCLQNTAEDRYSFIIRVDVEEGSDTENWSLSYPNIGVNYAGSSTFYTQGSAAIAEGVQVYEVVDQDNSACNVQVTVTPPNDCANIPNCSLAAAPVNLACNGDNFSFRMFVQGNDTGEDWTGVFPLADGSGGTFEIVRPISSSVFINDNYINYSTADIEQYLGGEVHYTIYQNSNPACTIEGTLYLTENGCDPNIAAAGDIDLSLDIQVPTNVVPYQNFTTDYIISNDGDVTATDVEVEVRLYNGFSDNVFVLQGGNEATASQGEFDGEFGTIWTVGSIAPGGSATLTLNMFSLVAGSSNIYGQVSQHNERDIDSNPNNFLLENFFLIEREDDEKAAVVTVSSNLQGGGTNNFTQPLNGLSATLYPVPTRGNLTVDIFMEDAVETQLSIRDTNGKELTAQNLAVQKGIQTLEFSTENWSNGVYFLQLFNGEEMKTYRFVKL